MVENANLKPVAKRYYRKKNDLVSLLLKMKLWPSRSGALHGLKSVEVRGEMAILATHCGHVCQVRNSRRGRAARWLRNKHYTGPCRACAVPEWKIQKYGGTVFSRGHGAVLPGGGAPAEAARWCR
jgi:pyrrolysyl-tRNA synthetase-like protein